MTLSSRDVFICHAHHVLVTASDLHSYDPEMFSSGMQIDRAVVRRATSGDVLCNQYRFKTRLRYHDGSQ